MRKSLLKLKTVDDRYGKVRRYVDNLSKWVRGGVVHYNNAVNMLARLATFTQVI